jgi:hypothetical protein
MLDYVLGGWVGELCMVCVVHLLILQVYPSSFGTGQWGRNGVLLFSRETLPGQQGIGKLSNRMSQSLILIDALSSAY